MDITKSTFVKVFLIAFFSLAIYCTGYIKGVKKGEEPKYKTLDEVSMRYFEVYGSPVDSIQQDKFQYIVYNEHYTD